MNPQYKEINDLIKQEIAEIREIDNFRKDELTRQYKYTFCWISNKLVLP